MADEAETPFYYVNAAQLHVAAYDMTFEFGYKTPEQAPTQRMTKLCTITMSLGHAKAMLPLMARMIAAYEQNVGKIPAPGYEEDAKE
jgi:hypothetical protein